MTFVEVSKLEFPEKYRVHHIPPDEMSEVGACPICTAPNTQKIGATEGTSGTGIEISFCPGCEHFYLSRRPDDRWLRDYYAEDWDTGRSEGAAPPAAGGERAVRGGWFRRAVAAVPGARLLYHRIRRNSNDGHRQGPNEAGSVVTDGRDLALISMLLGIGAGEGGIHSLDADRRILEIGCGYGDALQTFKNHGFECVGTEASRHRQSHCRERGLDVRLTHESLRDALNGADGFDIVYSSHVFEHMIDPLTAMREAGDLLADGGYAYVEVPNATIAENLVHCLHSAVHLHLFTPRSLSVALDQAGFQLVRMQVDGNLRAVAFKGRPAVSLAPFRDTGHPQSLIPWLTDTIPIGETLKMEYGHAHINLHTADGGTAIFGRQVPYSVKASDATVEFIVRAFDPNSPFPIKFVYDSPIAPFWVKTL